MRGKCKKTKRGKKQWTQEEKDLLTDMWGSFSVNNIARRLGRSADAVVSRARKMDLGPALMASPDPSLNSVYCAIYGSRAQGDYNLQRWIRHDLPYKNFRVRKNTFRTINLEAFWIWAEQHKELLDFSRFEKNLLGPEPAWVDVKRKADYESRHATQPHNKPWEAREDLTLKRMLARGGYTWTQIAAEVHRNEGACRRRANDLGIDISGIVRTKARIWTDEETRTLLQMRSEGYSFRQIGLRLGRGERAVEGKYERLNNPYYYKSRYRARSGKVDDIPNNIPYNRVKGIPINDVRRTFEDGTWIIPYEEAEAMS